MTAHLDPTGRPADRDSIGNADTLGLPEAGVEQPPTRPLQPGSPVSPSRQPSSDTAAAEDLVGQRIANRYTLLRLLGVGGMGAVFLARDDELDDLVALKKLHSRTAECASTMGILRREVRLARRVTHRNVARIYELGEHDKDRFLTMEYVAGNSLAALMERGRLPLMRSIAILEEVCAGLQAVHDAGIIHRDVKPHNVLVAHDGRVVISDFGVAGSRLDFNRSHQIPVGTPAYMAPEQLSGASTSPRSDVYSLGVMAFQMLTGDLPSQHLGTENHRPGAPPPDPRAVVPDLPEGLTMAVVRTLTYHAEERTPSPAQFAAELRAAAVLGTQLDSDTPAEPPGELPTPTVDGTPGRTPRTGTAASKLSVAVLPFVIRSADLDDYLADGFGEDLVDRLSSITELRVLSHGATAHLAGDPRQAHEIGAELGVAVVIAGSMQPISGDDVLIRVRAIAVADGVQIWAERYQVSPAELLAASDRVAHALARALADSRPAAQPSIMPNARALEAYLRAKQAYNHFFDLRRVIDLYELALELAGDSPLVQAGYAMAQLRAWMMGPDDHGQRVAKARNAAEAAMAAAPHLGDPHLALGLLHLHSGDPVAAMRGFRIAISLSPSMADAHAFLGMMLSELGRLDEAERRLNIALRLDPRSEMPRGDLRRNAALLGDWERAYALTRERSQPTTALGWMLTLRIAAYHNDHDYLRHIADEVAKLPKAAYRMRNIVTALLDAYLGRIPVATALAELPAIDVSEQPTLTTGDGRPQPSSSRRLALVSQLRAEVAGFGQLADEALDAIEYAIAHGLCDLLWLERCPLLDSIRSHPRFAQLHASVVDRAHAAYDAMWA